LHDLIPEYERQLGNKVQVNYGNPAVTLERLTKGDPETGIKTIAAVHSQCRSWVIRTRAIQAPDGRLPAMPPIATAVAAMQRRPRSAISGQTVPGQILPLSAVVRKRKLAELHGVLLQVDTDAETALGAISCHQPNSVPVLSERRRTNVCISFIRSYEC
jgi:hypothetical protein